MTEDLHTHIKLKLAINAHAKKILWILAILLKERHTYFTASPEAA